MKVFADTVLTMWKDSPQLLVITVMAVLIAVGLYQLIRMNGEIRKITRKIKRYLDAGMIEEEAPLQENPDQNTAGSGQGGYKKALSAQLTPEETKMLLAEDDSEAKERKKKNDEAIFNEVLREYF